MKKLSKMTFQDSDKADSMTDFSQSPKCQRAMWKLFLWMVSLWASPSHSQTYFWELNRRHALLSHRMNSTGILAERKQLKGSMCPLTLGWFRAGRMYQHTHLRLLRFSHMTQLFDMTYLYIYLTPLPTKWVLGKQLLCILWFFYDPKRIFI